MAQKIWIGCKLPSGVTIFDPTDKDRRFPIKINGVKHSRIKGAKYGLTQVDAEMWTLYKTVYLSWKPISSGAIFEIGADGSESAADREYAHVAKEKTGFEKTPRVDSGIKPDSDKED